MFADWRVVALLIAAVVVLIVAVIIFIKFKLKSDRVEELERENNCLCSRIEQLNIDFERCKKQIEVGGMTDEELVDDIGAQLDDIYGDWDGTISRGGNKD